MEILGAVRGRGSMILKTDQGIRQISPFDGSEERLEQEREFKENLYETGFHHIDRCVPNREGELITCDRYGNPYVMREYFAGREPNCSHKLFSITISLFLRYFISGGVSCMQKRGERMRTVSRATSDEKRRKWKKSGALSQSVRRRMILSTYI